MTKLFASDFDGTLHFEETGEMISAANLEAIRAFQAQGGLFGACTGRPLLGLTKQTGDAIPFDFYIATTGAAIFDRDCRLLWNRTLPREVVEEIYELVKPTATNGEFIMVVASEDYWTFSPGFPWPVVSYAKDFDEVRGPFYGVGLENPSIAVAEEAAALVNERYAGVAQAFVNQASIDVVPAGCSKGDGLRRAAELFGATITAGIGDSFNDVPLLDAADVGYTFRHADPAMHPHASMLVDAAHEAIYDFLSR